MSATEAPSFRQTATKLVCEKKSALIRLQLTDEDDVELAKGQIIAVRCTLYVVSKGPTFGQILNGRDHQSILDDHGGLVTPDGLLLLRFGPLDNVVTSQRRGYESHVTLIEWGWAGGEGAKEITFTVANQSKIP